MTLEQFWQQLAETKAEPSEGKLSLLEEFSRGSKIAPDRLTTVLAEGIRPYRFNVFSLSVLLSVCLLLMLVARTLVLLALPVNSPHQAIIAARDLQAGSVILSGDVRPAKLIQREEGFPSAGILQGEILTHSLPRGCLVHYGDVSRQQVMVTRDLPPGTVLSRNDLNLAWSPFIPQAMMDMNDVVKRKTQFGLQKGQMVVPDILMPKTK